MTQSPSRLYYTGDGRHGFAFAGRRDLDERDLAGLTEQQIADLLAAKHPETGKALYRRSKERVDDGDAKAAEIVHPEPAPVSE